MKKLVLLLLLLIVLAGILFASQKPTYIWHLPDKDVSLIVVDTPGTRELGLSGRSGLPENSAMLFVFDKPDIYSFWMKDMKFPIDIIWLDGSYCIIHLESALFPDTYPRTFGPAEKSLFVLETNAHFAEKNNLKVGDFLKIDLLK